MLTKLVWSRDENNYYYDIFLENASNELPVLEGIDINKTNGSKKDLILKHMYAIDAMIY